MPVLIYHRGQEGFFRTD